MPPISFKQIISLMGPKCSNDPNLYKYLPVFSVDRLSIDMCYIIPNLQLHLNGFPVLNKWISKFRKELTVETALAISRLNFWLSLWASMLAVLLPLIALSPSKPVKLEVIKEERWKGATSLEGVSIITGGCLATAVRSSISMPEKLSSTQSLFKTSTQEANANQHSKSKQSNSPFKPSICKKQTKGINFIIQHNLSRAMQTLKHVCKNH